MEDNWGFGNGETKPFREVIIGKNKVCGLHQGEHKHSSQDNKFYVKIGDSGTQDDYVGFNGHWNLVDVQFESSNYLKSSYLSGDEVRKTGMCKIFSDRIQVYEFFYRELNWALIKAANVISQLEEHASWWMRKDERAKLVGRKVYYHDEPAIITSIIEEQGCVILKPDGMEVFKDPIWLLEDKKDGQLWDMDERSSVKDDVLSPHIWWFRK